jgi:hypothetical protein
LSNQNEGEEVAAAPRVSHGLDQILNPVVEDTIAEPEIDIMTEEAPTNSPRLSNLHGQFSQMNVEYTPSPLPAQSPYPLSKNEPSVEGPSTQESNIDSTGYANQVVRIHKVIVDYILSITYVFLGKLAFR